VHTTVPKLLTKFSVDVNEKQSGARRCSSANGVHVFEQEKYREAILGTPIAKDSKPSLSVGRSPSAEHKKLTKDPKCNSKRHLTKIYSSFGPAVKFLNEQQSFEGKESPDLILKQSNFKQSTKIESGNIWPTVSDKNGRASSYIKKTMEVQNFCAMTDRNIITAVEKGRVECKSMSLPNRYMFEDPFVTSLDGKAKADTKIRVPASKNSSVRARLALTRNDKSKFLKFSDGRQKVEGGSNNLIVQQLREHHKEPGEIYHWENKQYVNEERPFYKLSNKFCFTDPLAESQQCTFTGGYDNFVNGDQLKFPNEKIMKDEVNHKLKKHSVDRLEYSRYRKKLNRRKFEENNKPEVIERVCRFGQNTSSSETRQTMRVPWTSKSSCLQKGEEVSLPERLLIDALSKPFTCSLTKVLHQEVRSVPKYISWNNSSRPGPKNQPDIGRAKPERRLCVDQNRRSRSKQSKTTTCSNSRDSFTVNDRTSQTEQNRSSPNDGVTYQGINRTCGNLHCNPNQMDNVKDQIIKGPQLCHQFSCESSNEANTEKANDFNLSKKGSPWPQRKGSNCYSTTTENEYVFPNTKTRLLDSGIIVINGTSRYRPEGVETKEDSMERSLTNASEIPHADLQKPPPTYGFVSAASNKPNIKQSKFLKSTKTQDTSVKSNQLKSPKSNPPIKEESHDIFVSAAIKQSNFKLPKLTIPAASRDIGSEKTKEWAAKDTPQGKPLPTNGFISAASNESQFKHPNWVAMKGVNICSRKNKTEPQQLAIQIKPKPTDDFVSVTRNQVSNETFKLKKSAAVEDISVGNNNANVGPATGGVKYQSADSSTMFAVTRVNLSPSNSLKSSAKRTLRSLNSKWVKHHEGISERKPPDTDGFISGVRKRVDCSTQKSLKLNEERNINIESQEVKLPYKTPFDRPPPTDGFVCATSNQSYFKPPKPLKPGLQRVIGSGIIPYKCPKFVPPSTNDSVRFAKDWQSFENSSKPPPTCGFVCAGNIAKLPKAKSTMSRKFASHNQRRAIILQGTSRPPPTNGFIIAKSKFTLNTEVLRTKIDSGSSKHLNEKMVLKNLKPTSHLPPTNDNFPVAIKVNKNIPSKCVALAEEQDTDNSKRGVNSKSLVLRPPPTKGIINVVEDKAIVQPVKYIPALQKSPRDNGDYPSILSDQLQNNSSKACTANDIPSLKSMKTIASQNKVVVTHVVTNSTLITSVSTANSGTISSTVKKTFKPPGSLVSRNEQLVSECKIPEPADDKADSKPSFPDTEFDNSSDPSYPGVNVNKFIDLPLKVTSTVNTERAIFKPSEFSIAHRDSLELQSKKQSLEKDCVSNGSVIEPSIKRESSISSNLIFSLNHANNRLNYKHAATQNPSLDKPNNGRFNNLRQRRKRRYSELGISILNSLSERSKRKKHPMFNSRITSPSSITKSENFKILGQKFSKLTEKRLGYIPNPVESQCWARRKASTSLQYLHQGQDYRREPGMSYCVTNAKLSTSVVKLEKLGKHCDFEVSLHGSLLNNIQAAKRGNLKSSHLGHSIDQPQTSLKDIDTLPYLGRPPGIKKMKESRYEEPMIGHPPGHPKRSRLPNHVGSVSVISSDKTHKIQKIKTIGSMLVTAGCTDLKFEDILKKSRLRRKGKCENSNTPLLTIKYADTRTSNNTEKVCSLNSIKSDGVIAALLNMKSALNKNRGKINSKRQKFKAPIVRKDALQSRKSPTKKPKESRISFEINTEKYFPNTNPNEIHSSCKERGNLTNNKLPLYCEVSPKRAETYLCYPNNEPKGWKEIFNDLVALKVDVSLMNQKWVRHHYK
jgi:hypothetical protein